MAADDGTLNLQLYDLSATPHRLVGQQRVDEGADVDLGQGESVLTIRLLPSRM
jgi:hypothetical protein